MNDATNPGSGLPPVRPVLPEGFSFQVSQNLKTYQWKHNYEISSGDVTLNGLRKPTESGGSATLPKLAKVPARSLGEISDEMAKTISQNYMNLPAILEGMGIKLMEDQRDAFIKRATLVKQKLAQTYGSREIPAKIMRQADAQVNQLSFKAVEVVIKGFSVTRNNPKGSRQRKTDGLFVTERVLRRVTVAAPLTEEQLQQVLTILCGELVSSMTRAAEYRITKRGTDSHGRPVVAITLAGYGAVKGRTAPSRDRPRGT